MTFSVPHGACDLQAAVCLVATGINPEPWSYFAEQDAWRFICATLLEGRLRAYIIGLESGKTYEAERGQFAGLEGRLSEVRMRAIALRDSLGQNHWSPFCELFFYEGDLRVALRAESAVRTKAAAPRGRSGRPRRYNRERLEDEVVRLMDYHGEFDVDDREWNCQARLEDALAQFCIEKLGDGPAHSTLAAPISSGLAKWRQRNHRIIADN